MRVRIQDKIIILLFLIVFCGCATASKLEKKISPFIGCNIEKLTDKWGYPEGSFIAPNGNKVYVYTLNSISLPKQEKIKYSGANYTDGSYSGQIYKTGGGSTEFFCKIFFEVDKDNVITKC